MKEGLWKTVYQEVTGQRIIDRGYDTGREDNGGFDRVQRHHFWRDFINRSFIEKKID